MTPPSLGESLCFDTAPAVSGASLETGHDHSTALHPGNARPFSWARLSPTPISGVSLPVGWAERQEEEKGTQGWRWGALRGGCWAGEVRAKVPMALDNRSTTLLQLSAGIERGWDEGVGGNTRGGGAVS